MITAREAALIAAQVYQTEEELKDLEYAIAGAARGGEFHIERVVRDELLTRAKELLLPAGYRVHIKPHGDNTTALIIDWSRQ